MDIKITLKTGIHAKTTLSWLLPFKVNEVDSPYKKMIEKDRDIHTIVKLFKL